VNDALGRSGRVWSIAYVTMGKTSLIFLGRLPFTVAFGSNVLGSIGRTFVILNGDKHVTF
jgi:hypothetical protein